MYMFADRIFAKHTYGEYIYACGINIYIYMCHRPHRGTNYSAKLLASNLLTFHVLATRLSLPRQATPLPQTCSGSASADFLIERFAPLKATHSAVRHLSLGQSTR